MKEFFKEEGAFIKWSIIGWIFVIAIAFALASSPVKLLATNELVALSDSVRLSGQIKMHGGFGHFVARGSMSENTTYTFYIKTDGGYVEPRSVEVLKSGLDKATERRVIFKFDNNETPRVEVYGGGGDKGSIVFIIPEGSLVDEFAIDME